MIFLNKARKSGKLSRLPEVLESGSGVLLEHPIHPTLNVCKHSNWSFSGLMFRFGEVSPRLLSLSSV